jgi:nucleotide-binding universal stress UspA family protein
MGSIVVGYDGSECGDVALASGLELAKEVGDRVVVVFGYAPPGIWGGEIADHETVIEERGKALLEAAQAKAADRGEEIDAVLVAKRATEALLDVAEERDARMIVVGGTGESALKGIILGSTPNKLLHVSGRPVLVVPANK